jgi:ribose/xylose/arabinose/galactoside ABC-type transport system permease subunit
MSNRNPSTNQASKPVNGEVRNSSQFIKIFLKKSGMLPALILLLVVGSLVSENFLSVTNISNVLRFAAIIGFISIGQTLVILSGGGGIDLSVASVAAASAVTGALYQSSGSPVVVIVAVSTGVFFGLINGLGVTVGGLQPFIVTLATFTIARGVAFDLTNAQPLYLKSDDLKLLSTGFIGRLSL